MERERERQRKERERKIEKAGQRWRTAMTMTDLIPAILGAVANYINISLLNLIAEH